MSHACKSFLETLQILHAFYSLFSRCTQSLALATRKDIWTSKSARTVPVNFLHFWLRNSLRATTACNFSTSQLPTVLREECALHILTSKYASRHNGNFSSLIWPDGSAPGTLASLLFDPPEPQIIGETQCFATFLPFRAPAPSFLWLFLFSHLLSSSLLWLFPPLLFHLPMLSEVWLLNFLRLI